MKKTLKYFLVGLAVISIINLISVSDIKAQRIDKVLKKGEKRLKSVKTVRADVEMLKYSFQFDETDRKQGQVIFAREKNKKDFYARIDWVTPITESLSIIEDDYVLYLPRLNRVIAGKMREAGRRSEAENIFSFMNMSAAELKGNYSFKLLRENEKLKNGVKTVHLEITSKSPTVYKTAEIWVDKKGFPVQSKITENNNDSTTVLLQKIKRNKKIDRKAFTITYPKKTIIIKG